MPRRKDYFVTAVAAFEHRRGNKSRLGCHPLRHLGYKNKRS
ncbi:hypothetical protein REIFOR_02631 [Reinekea forsetii]|uniref:Uncharacterized protein n=1 Tax=Reinekea forsetii TaxID=1336806 RepID=A0A2K8KSP0_9GAMM|nr:hypothetical protein REIFOR_02631 [Reinekea forsetii]